jgi:hypothetical protein
VGLERAISERGEHTDRRRSTELQSILDQLKQFQMPPNNEQNRIELIQRALLLIDRQRDAMLWGTLQGTLGNSLSETTLGDPAENIDRAIYAYQEAAQVLTPETQPVVWAITMNNVAKLFARRINGDRVDNLDRALNAFRQALTILSNGSISGTMPQESQDIILYSLSRPAHKRTSIKQLILEHDIKGLGLR